MTAISGISKQTFMKATKDALSRITGRTVKLHQLRQFVAAQFKLRNEHLIEPMFSNTGVPLPGGFLEPLDIDVGARGILLNHLQHMFVYRDTEGHIGGYWPDSPLSDDGYFVPLHGVEWWQESPFIFPSHDLCRRSLPPEIFEDPRYQVVEVREIPELHKALCDAVMFSTLPPSDAENSLDMITHFFCASRDAHQAGGPHGNAPSSYAMYVYNAFRYMLTRMLPASVYPNIEQSTSVATLYALEIGFGENVSALSLSQRIALWASSGDHGISSRFLFSHMTGLSSVDLVSTLKSGCNAPDDAQAFLCCAQLLECIPEWKTRMQEMAQYDIWKPYVAEWHSLTSILMQESNLTDEPLYDRRLHHTQTALKKIKADIKARHGI
jgi:hypothetical protein